jgi:hypothetical protein
MRIRALSMAAARLLFGNRIERRAIEFPVVAIGYPYGAMLRLKFRPDQTQFDSKLVGSVRREVKILQDDTALVLVLFADHEIKIVVGHPKSLISVCAER